MDVRIPTYWFWFPVFLGLLCLVPCWRRGLGAWELQPGGLILASVYTVPGSDLWKRVLPVHTVLATALASIATVFTHIRAQRKSDLSNLLHTTWSLGTGLLATSVIAAIFGLLSWADAPAVLYVCVLVAVAGQPATALLVGLFGRRN